MTNEDIIKKLKLLGLSDKAARFYLAAWELDQGSILQISRRAKLQRTSLYYTVNELLELGAIVETKVMRKIIYKALSPAVLLKRMRERVAEFEDVAEQVTSLHGRVFEKPKVYFLYDVAGFKELWDRILSSKISEYCITTNGEGFLDYVQEKYILANIIRRKRTQNIRSRQLIVSSAYSQKIIKKDKQENRESKLLPAHTKLDFTEIICGDFVALIGPRAENLIMILESQSLAETRLNLFNALWENLPRT